MLRRDCLKTFTTAAALALPRLSFGTQNKARFRPGNVCVINKTKWACPLFPMLSPVSAMRLIPQRTRSTCSCYHARPIRSR